MCGILGQINYLSSIVDKESFTKALDLQSHRGPDYGDIFQCEKIIFGHRRLSIIDLDVEAKQPMTSQCGNYVLVFNGEIYNYLELKEELIQKGYQFVTQSDTEVLLKSFIEYGIACIEKLIGMFAFAIFDKKRETTYIVRDRLGIKPLYYYKDDNKFIFSSEIKSILALSGKQEFNRDAVSSYLAFRYPILNDTFFKNIFSLAPAYYITVQNKRVSFTEYWNVSEKFKEQKQDQGEAYYISRLKELMDSSVKLRMRSDVPLGSFLSGGVDSSIITALMAKNSQKKVKTFTIGFQEEGFNEFEFAHMLADKYETDHKEIIIASDNYIETMELLIGYKDAPLSVPNEVPLYLMSKELKKDITVVLSGEGADEIFGGYGRIFRSPYDYERIKNIDKLSLSNEEKESLCKNFIKKYCRDSFQNEIDHFMNIYSYTSIDERKKLLSRTIDIEHLEVELQEKFLSYFNELEDDSYYNKLLYVFEKVHLLGLLHRVDTTTMAASVEARVPFVDHRLVEFAFSIPIQYKLKWIKERPAFLMSDQLSEEYDTPKYLLKKAYEDIIPKEILYRKKMGFPVPLNHWFKGGFNSYARKKLLSTKAKDRDLYNTEEIEKVLSSKKIQTNHSLAMKIWMLVNLELFLEKYFDEE